MHRTKGLIMNAEKIYPAVGALLFIAFFCLSMTSNYDNDLIPRREKAFTTYVNDSVTLDIYLEYNDESYPLKYYGHVITPVCEEGLCYVITLDVYWDLLGNFLTYEEMAEDPLTKFDHVKLTTSDHKKLNEILSNKNSLLKNYGVEDLVDKSVQIKSDVVVDAVAGATYPSLKGAVVKGAVYSSYTLWHIVNGRVAKEIAENTEALIDDSLLIHMLKSDNYNLQFYALNKIDVANPKFIPDLIGLISKGDSYVPFFAIDKLNDSTWNTPKYQERIINMLQNVDFEMQNEILNRINKRELTTNAVKIVVSNLTNLDHRQQQKALGIINNEKISYAILLELSYLLNAKDSVLSHSIYKILNAKGRNYNDIDERLRKYELTK
ncbi:MAG: hypothetical protein HKN31_12750 [Pricia sp.]|nr:hypothetical protein [Pricia sp.]